MTVKEVMTGITPSADYAGLEMADDFVLAFQTADTQKDVNDYIVCQECITEHSAAVNPGTQDKQYIRKGNATIKTSAQRTFSISGDRTHGDAWQDWVTSLAVMFGTGSAVIVPSCTSSSSVPGRYCTSSFSASGAMAQAACCVCSALRLSV